MFWLICAFTIISSFQTPLAEAKNDGFSKSKADRQLEAKEVQAREQERTLMETREQEKYAELLTKHSKLSPAEKHTQESAATEFGETGMDFFRGGQFEQADVNFIKAHELDPAKTDYYYSHGVTLFKLKKYSESLVILKRIASGQFNPLERDFYVGLNYYNLNENENALKVMKGLKMSQDINIAPSANFYEGMILFRQTNYDKAKMSFQEVLDTSKDPRLDDQAEEYIERIEQVRNFLKYKEKKWFISATTGVEYDSNVLLVSSSDPSSNSPSQVADVRYLEGTQFEYRPIFTKENEFSIRAKGDFIYSASGNNVAADPLVYGLKAPYKYKGMLFGKGYKLEVIPGIEKLYLDELKLGVNQGITGSLGYKKIYIDSTLLDITNTFVMSDDRFMGVNFKIRRDTSFSTLALGDNDPSAFKFGVDWMNMLFLNKKKTQGFISDIGFTNNSATGKNLFYVRYDASLGYMFPLANEFQAMTNISYYMANYPNSAPIRTDSDVAVTANVSKSLVSWLSATVGGVYTYNGSSITSNTYNKYIAMGLLTGNWSF